jgi:hypothetical protein
MNTNYIAITSKRILTLRGGNLVSENNAPLGEEIIRSRQDTPRAHRGDLSSPPLNHLKVGNAIMPPSLASYTYAYRSSIPSWNCHATQNPDMNTLGFIELVPQSLRIHSEYPE